MSTYQELAKRTYNSDVQLTDLERLSNFLIGLAGEVIELGQVLSKPLSDRRREAVANEAGDVRWYIASIHTALGLTEHQTRPKNEEVEDACYVASDRHAHENLLRWTGELLEYLKKGYWHKHPVEQHILIAKLIKVRAAWAGFVIVSGLRTDDIERINIAKLEKRFPDGFKSEDSMKRQDTIAFSPRYEE